MSGALKAPDFRQIEQARAKVAATPSWPPLDTLAEATAPEPGPFPFEGLGPLLGDAAQAIARDVQAPCHRPP